MRFSLETDGYVTNEMSLLVPHMFRNFRVLEWGFARNQDPIVYMVRDDGTLLCFTYNEEQEVLAWRSEEHTSELQSLMRISYAVFCLKKKTKYNIHIGSIMSNK